VASKQLRAYLDEEWEFEIPTSFIDCVFLLLIFFLLTAKFKSMERVLSANLPKNEGPKDDPNHEIVEPVEIRVKMFWQDGLGRVISRPEQAGGRAHIMIKANNIPCSDLNDLARKLAEVASRDNTTKVVIDARNHVPYRFVLGAVDACARAEMPNVVFQSPPARDGGGGEWWYQ